MTIIKDTPDKLVENGKFHTGFFKMPFKKVNMLEADNFGGKFGDKFGDKFDKAFRWLRLKEWVGFGVIHPRLFGGIIIQDAKYATSGTVYLYDREEKRQYEWLVLDIPTRAKLAETLYNSESSCKSLNGYMRFIHDIDNNQHRMDISIKKNRKSPAIKVNLTLHQFMDKVEPLVVSLPIEPDHHTFTHKSPLQLEGNITIGDKSYDFDPKRDLGNLDEQKTFYPYHSNWKWGCFTTFSKAGNLVSLNFVNQMTQHDEQGEDCMWVDGKLMLLDMPEITELDNNGTYSIKDKSGRIDLTYKADGAKAEKQNFLVITMDYKQNYGNYNGTVTDEDGTVHQIENAYGALEMMQAKF